MPAWKPSVAPKRDSAVNHMVLAEETTEFGASQDYVEPGDRDGIKGSHVDTEIPVDEILQDGWSCLKYIEVDVEGLNDTVIALNDSGCQLCAVNAETVRSLDLPVCHKWGVKSAQTPPCDILFFSVCLESPENQVTQTPFRIKRKI